MRTDTVRAKVNPELKKAAENVLNELGLSMSEAINLMLVQVKLTKSLPFELTLPKEPNKETLQALQDAENNKNLNTYSSPEDCINKLC